MGDGGADGGWGWGWGTWCSVCLIFEAPPNRRLMRRLSCPTSTGAAFAAVRVLTGKTPAIDAL